MNGDERTERLVILMTPEEKHSLMLLANAKGETMSHLVRRALRRYAGRDDPDMMGVREGA